MRTVFATLLCLSLACAAHAASPEEAYIAAHEAAIAKIKKLEAKKGAEKAVEKENESALADLEKRLRAIIGDLAVKPYPATGKIAQSGLSENEVGSGGIDALRFAKADDGPQVYVTTEGFLAKFVKKPEEWWKQAKKRPPSVEDAFHTDEFYTYAIGVDAAFSRIAEIPLKSPQGATIAAALLGGWAQDVGPNPNQELLVVIRKGGKVYFATETAKSYKDIPACETIWKDAQAKAETLYKKYADGGAKDQKTLDAYNVVNDRADRDYRACYAEKTPKAAFFPSLVEEAQSVANRFASTADK